MATRRRAPTNIPTPSITTPTYHRRLPFPQPGTPDTASRTQRRTRATNSRRLRRAIPWRRFLTTRALQRPTELRHNRMIRRRRLIRRRTDTRRPTRLRRPPIQLSQLRTPLNPPPFPWHRLRHPGRRRSPRPTCGARREAPRDKRSSERGAAVKRWRAA